MRKIYSTLLLAAFLALTALPFAAIAQTVSIWNMPSGGAGGNGLIIVEW